MKEVFSKLLQFIMSHKRIQMWHLALNAFDEKHEC